MESEIEKTATLTENLSTIAKTSPQNMKFTILPSVTGKNHITDEDRNLFALPLKMGG